MSWQPTTDPECIVDPTRAPIDTVIVPRRRDVGGFDVMRGTAIGRAQSGGSLCLL